MPAATAADRIVSGWASARTTRFYTERVTEGIPDRGKCCSWAARARNPSPVTDLLGAGEMDECQVVQTWQEKKNGEK